MNFKGEEWLWYPEIPLDVVVIRGTHADSKGNLTTDEEAMTLEVLHAVLAAKRFGGKVIAQVKYCVEEGTLHPKRVTVPASFIDHIVVCDNPEEDHRQSSSWFFDPTLCGDIRTPVQQTTPLPLDIRKLIGRIACRYLYENCVINLERVFQTMLSAPLFRKKMQLSALISPWSQGFGAASKLAVLILA